MVSVGRQEWFVFRRYAEFDKLYNTVSPITASQIKCATRDKNRGAYDTFNDKHMFFLLTQLRKQFPSMNLKIPAKRIFGDNFDPGECRAC